MKNHNSVINDLRTVSRGLEDSSLQDLVDEAIVYLDAYGQCKNCQYNLEKDSLVASCSLIIEDVLTSSEFGCNQFEDKQ